MTSNATPQASITFADVTGDPGITDDSDWGLYIYVVDGLWNVVVVGNSRYPDNKVHGSAKWFTVDVQIGSDSTKNFVAFSNISLPRTNPTTDFTFELKGPKRQQSLEYATNVGSNQDGLQFAVDKHTTVLEFVAKVTKGTKGTKGLSGNIYLGADCKPLSDATFSIPTS